MIKSKHFDSDQIFIEEKSQENIFIYDISYKTLIGKIDLCILDSIKQMDLLEFMMELHI